MERFSNRENILLGYSPQRTFANTPISSPNANSDIDFNDVFGGPPRRASIQETRCSFAETTETYEFRKSDDETSSHSHRWSGLSEKPVFGEEGITRRRYPSHDFFDDIFKGNESLMSSSPRKNDRDPFSSSPGSRVLSPVRPLPPSAEPFASSSLPSQFSLPAKLIKGTDLPTFGSSGRNHHKNKDSTSNGTTFYSYSPLSRFSSQANQVQEESSRNDVYLQSSLSHEPSLSTEDSSNLTKPDGMEKASHLKKDSSISDHFHFSIYKWASKGVPLALPLRGGNGSKSKEKIKLDRSSSASGRIACEMMAKELSVVNPQDIDRYTVNNSISSNGKSSEIEFDKRENGYLFNTSTHSRVEQVQAAEEAVLPKSDSQNPNTLREDSSGNITFQNSKQDTEPQFVKGLSRKIEEQFPTATQEASKNEIKTLRSLLIGTDEIAVKNELKESKVKSTKKPAAVFNVTEKVKKKDGKGTVLNSEEMDKADLQGSPTNSQEGLAKNQGRGKVKEFVKIFNQEASNKHKFNENPQIESLGWKERGKFKTQDDANITTTKVDEFLKQSDKQHSRTKTDNSTSMGISSGLKDRSTSTAEIPGGLEAVVAGLDDSFQGNILVKELPQDDDKHPQASDNREEIQVIDAKIRKWSNGREANIRSLLSTLQYVLWPESGWKPVPLVDIIEGNAVKKSYQKALLSLHPDKLQQKGATSHQKYIAEKVFDILQEAWTHFNSLDSL